MARWVGEIGLTTEVDQGDGIIDVETKTLKCKGEFDIITVDKYFHGEINQSYGRRGEIRVVATKWLLNNADRIEWVTYNGTKWQPTIKINPPYIELTLGGVYAKQAD